METIIRQRALLQGFYFARSLLDPGELSELREAIWEICRGRGSFSAESQHFLDIQREVQNLPAFSALRSNKTLRRIVDALLGANAADQQGDICRIAFPRAPEHTTPAHQDQYFLRRQDELWISWIPLAGCSRTEGSLAVVPRSHVLGILPHDDRGRAIVPPGTRWRHFDFCSGDVLFFHALTVHRALENRSTRPRISVDFRFSR